MGIDQFLALSYKEKLAEVNKRKNPVWTAIDARHRQEQPFASPAEEDRFWALETVYTLIGAAHYGISRLCGGEPNRLTAKFVLECLALADQQIAELGL